MDEVFVIAHSASNASGSIGWEVVPLEEDLMHHGRKDQKWGVRNGPPYPLQMAKTAYKAAQKAAVATGKGVAKAAKGTAKAAKAVTKKSVEVAKKAKAKKEEHDVKVSQKKKQKAISNNSYEELWNIKDKLSYKDLSDAISRIELEQKIYSRAFPPKPTFSDKIYKITKKMGDANNWYQTAKKTWNNFAELYNSTNPDKPLGTIGGKGGKNKKGEGKKGEENNSNGGGKNKDKEKEKGYQNVFQNAGGTNIYNIYTDKSKSEDSKNNKSKNNVDKGTVKNPPSSPSSKNKKNKNNKKSKK